MSAETFSAYHEFVASALAREMNAYFRHCEKLQERFKQCDVRGNPPVFTDQACSTTHELQIKIIVLTAIYVEALANLYLSLKLNAEQFMAIDRLEAEAKWATIPSLFLPNYSLPKSEAIFSDLKTLIGQRNAIAHMKPKITGRGKIIQGGNLPKRIQRMELQVQRWDRLPEGLIDHLGKHDRSTEYQKFRALSSIDDYTTIRKKGYLPQ